MASRKRLVRTVALTAALVLGLATSDVLADTDGPSPSEKETARALMQAGDEKLVSGDARGALEAYSGADAIMRVPTTALAVGKSHARLGMLVEAIDAFQRAMRHPVARPEPPAYAGARREAAELDAELAPRVPSVLVRVTGAGSGAPLTVSVDGKKLSGPPARQPRRVNPGKHAVAISAPGFEAATRSIEVRETERAVIELTLAPAAAERDKTVSREERPLLPIGAWIGFGLSAAGLVVGTATGVVVLKRTEALEQRCGGRQCPATEEDEHTTIMALANTSNVAFAVAGAAAGVGLGMVLWDVLGNDDPDASLSVSAGPTALHVLGRF